MKTSNKCVHRWVTTSCSVPVLLSCVEFSRFHKAQFDTIQYNWLSKRDFVLQYVPMWSNFCSVCVVHTYTRAHTDTHTRMHIWTRVVAHKSYTLCRQVDNARRTQKLRKIPRWESGYINEMTYLLLNYKQSKKGRCLFVEPVAQDHNKFTFPQLPVLLRLLSCVHWESESVEVKNETQTWQ